MRLARTTFGILGLILATPCAIAAILAQGGRFSPRLDLLTQLAPFYLAGAVLAAVIAAMGERVLRRTGVVVALIAAIAAGALIAPEFLRSTGPTASAGAPGQIKVIEINAWRQNPHPDRLVDWLQAEDPDMIVIPESSVLLREMILRRMHRAGVAGWSSSVMTFARKPYLRMDRPVIDRATRLTFVNATYDSQSGPYEVVATHYDWPTSRRQPIQSVGLAGVVARLPRERMILAGDFNSAPWSFRRRYEDRAFGLIRRDRALATWPTGHAGPWRWAAPFPFMPIDHLYAGPGWATVSVRRGPRVGSDHYPLVVILAPVAPR